jgi:DDE superfamily endonuclease
VKESGTGVQGHQRQPVENAKAILQTHEHLKSGLSFDAAVKATAAAEVASPSTIRAAVTQFLVTGNLPQPDTARCGRGHPSHSLHSSNTDVYGPSFPAEVLMHDLVHKQTTDGVSITATTIAADLRAALGVNVHRRTVRRWLRALGYRWRSKRYVGGMKPQAKNARIRQFVLEYAAALAEEEKGDAVVVYMDESFIYAHHARRMGWFHQSSRDVIGDDDGKRLIILHAMTDRGLLAVPDTIASNWLNEPALTAELVFEEVLEDGQDDSDYHNTMTGAKFVAWLRNRLLPTFAELHPGKKMYLVLDNASYHKARDETWIGSSKSMSKHELAHQLLDMGVASLTTTGDSRRVIPSHLFEATNGKGGPSKDDLAAAVQKWLEEHPDHNRTVVEQLMSDAGHSLVYTPPFCPEVQPIELLWAQIKRYVADRSTHKRSMTEAREQTEAAFEQVTKMFCNSVVKHCHDWIDRFLSTEAAEDLQQCGTLAGVMKYLQLLKLAETTLPRASTSQPPPIQLAAPATSASQTHPARSLRKRH